MLRIPITAAHVWPSHVAESRLRVVPVNARICPSIQAIAVLAAKLLVSTPAHGAYILLDSRLTIIHSVGQQRPAVQEIAQT